MFSSLNQEEQLCILQSQLLLLSFFDFQLLAKLS